MARTLTGNYPIADELHQTQLSLPISYGHTPRDIKQVCDAVALFKS